MTSGGNSGSDNVGRGMAIMILAMVMVPFMDAIAKSLSVYYDVSPATTTFSRFLIQAVVLGIVVAFGVFAGSMRWHFSWINIIRGVLMGATALMFFIAIKYMPLADAIAIVFIEPFIVMLMSAFFLGEKVGWRRILAAMIGFGGSILIIQPSYELFGLVSLLPAASALLYSTYIILTRVSGSKDNPVLMQFFAGLGGTAICGLALLAGSATGTENLTLSLPQLPVAWWLLLGIGLIAVVSHLLIVVAFSMAPASVLAPFQYVEIIMATLFGLWLFGDFPDLIKWIGVFIIVGSGIYIFVRERQLQKQMAG